MGAAMMPRTCRACGRVFDGGPRAWYCPACREERKKQAYRQYRQRKAAGNTRPIGSIDLCEICGKPYTVEGGLQRFCPDCAPAHLKAVDNAQSLAYKQAHPDAVKAANVRFAARNEGRMRKNLWRNKIAQLRQAKGMTQAQLAAAIGSTQGRVSGWETGKRKPDATNTAKLCAALDADALE